MLDKIIEWFFTILLICLVGGVTFLAVDQHMAPCPNGYEVNDLIHHKTGIAGVIVNCYKERVDVSTGMRDHTWKWKHVNEFEVQE